MSGEKFEDKDHVGRFLQDRASDLHGTLKLRGVRTALTLYSNDFISGKGCDEVFGQIYRGPRVSLYDCCWGGVSSTSGQTGTSYSTEIFPHYVVYGEEHLKASEEVIESLEFVIDDAEVIFNDQEAFGQVIENSRLQMESIIANQPVGHQVACGDFPYIFYFTGNDEIFSAQIELGAVTVRHSLSYSSPSPKGISVPNKIVVSIRFSSPKNFKDSIRAVDDLLSFFKVLAGRPQNISDLIVETRRGGAEPTFLDVYWSYPPQRSGEFQFMKSVPRDVPIQACSNPEEFRSVFQDWMSREEEWKVPRQRFWSSMSQGRDYTVDRLICSANSFDILPASAVPAIVEIDDKLEQACKDARASFGELPQSLERDSILGALGRIGQATLKRKIRHRVEMITEQLPEVFPNIELITDFAVNARNYFVHGSSGKYDREVYFENMPILTKTLEFVFVASDLIDSGWDIENWHSRGIGEFHFLACYLRNYSVLLAKFEESIYPKVDVPPKT